MRDHKFPFTLYTEASLNLAEDEEMLAMMREAHFTRVFLGIETPVAESLKETTKFQNLRKDLLESVKLIQSYGMEVMAGFIVGFDNDPPDVFDRQIEFIRRGGDSRSPWSACSRPCPTPSCGGGSKRRAGS